VKQLLTPEREDTPTKAVSARRHKPERTCGFCVRLRWIKERHAQKQALLPAMQRWNQRKHTFVQHYTDPKSPGFNNAKQSAILAGYAPHTAQTRGPGLLKDPQTRAAIIAAFERAGITGDFLGAKVREGLEATEVRLAGTAAPVPLRRPGMRERMCRTGRRESPQWFSPHRV